MKKLFYLTLFITSLIGTLCMLIAPIYKFNDKKISQNNTEIIAMILDTTGYLDAYRDNSNQVELSKEAKEEYKNNYYYYNQKAYSILNGDAEIFYEVNDYEVLNAIYKDTLNKEGTLDINSSDDAIGAIEKVLQDLLGEEEFNNKKNQEVEKQINKYKENILQTVKESMNFSTTKEAETFLIKNAKNVICDEFFVLFVGYDDYLIDSSIEEIDTKGIKLKHLLTSVSNIYKVDKAVWQKNKYVELKFIQKVKAVINDQHFYNPLPLLVLLAVIFAILIGQIILIFKGLQGMRGVKYPHAFISSIINAALCLLLIIGPSFIPNSYYLKYHFTEFSRFLDLFRYGYFSYAIIISLLVYLLALGISIFGRFFRWGKRKKQNN